MSSDIRFEGDTVIVDGLFLTSHTLDFNLDAPGRRGTLNPTTPRRALVHSGGDSLTMNYARDYPGGVTIMGEVNIPDSLTAKEIRSSNSTAKVLLDGQAMKAEVWDFCVDSPSRRSEGSDPATPRRALVHDFDDGLTLNYAADYPGGVTVQGDLRVPKRVEVGDSTFRVELGPGTIQVKTYFYSIIGGPPPPPPETFDLVAEIKSLKEKVTELEAKLAQHLVGTP